jgi:hypothetical protein
MSPSCGAAASVCEVLTYGGNDAVGKIVFGSILITGVVGLTVLTKGLASAVPAPVGPGGTAFPWPNQLSNVAKNVPGLGWIIVAAGFQCGALVFSGSAQIGYTVGTWWQQNDIFSFDCQTP